jgi:ribosomal-protein-alanine N-acetyltransferase
MAIGWPASLQDGRVGLRAPRMRDALAWSTLRTNDEEWLSPWEGRPPQAPESTWAERHTPAAYGATLRVWRREARAGRALPFLVTYDGDVVGQLTAMNVQLGAFRSTPVGYWVSSEVAGRGVIPTALALLVDHCFTEVGLHRVEANIRPENAASRRVVEKLGFREEGRHARYLFIDGAWRDHLMYAVTAEDVPEGLLARWHARQKSLKHEADTPGEIHRRA